MFCAGCAIAKRVETMKRTTLGALLRQHRVAMGLTQEALAARANLSTRAISDLERGLSRAPRFDTLALLTKAMDRPPARAQRSPAHGDWTWRGGQDPARRANRPRSS